MSFDTPWYKFYGNIPTTIDYPKTTMVEEIKRVSIEYPDYPAYDFLGKKVKFKEFYSQIETCAKALKSIGVKENDAVTICLPNTPQAIIMFYAVNLIGGLANMVHPLSAEKEIEFYIKECNCKYAITLDTFYNKFSNINFENLLDKLIIASVKDYLPGIKKTVYSFTKGLNDPKIEKSDKVILFKDLMLLGKSYIGDFAVKRKPEDPAVILYSGGTTGTTKGILLSNLNFNALALQTGTAGDCITPGHDMLSIMPVFHGFGLGICIHTALVYGCKCILVPQFTVKTYANLLKKYKPNFIAGVPTLYEALLRVEDIDNLDLSNLMGVFSGGDSLSIELKRKVDKFLKDHGSKEQVREGYGTTECVTASCLTPKNFFREGSIGIPFPDTLYKIVIPSTHETAKYGDIGEICISGPTVMLGYLNNPKETAQTLQQHDDGRIWLHTGDLGSMDEDGFVYFKQRMKRVIISSGYNIYPSQIENVIDAFDDVLMSTVIGVHDDYKMQKVKAFVVLKPGIEPTEEIKKALLEHCKKYIAKYAIPYEFEFRSELPKTLVGKVAYTVLEKEEKSKGEK